MSDARRFYEGPASGSRRSAPAALRNRQPIADVLAQWLPSKGRILEIASGTGEHVTFFARQFPGLEWQPSDIHPDALASMKAWIGEAQLPNVREPLVLDASATDWPLHGTGVAGGIDDPSGATAHGPAENSGFCAVLCLNMVHISPWRAALGLLEGSARVLAPGGLLILYGPWLQEGVVPAPSNLEFDRSLRARDPEWGLRRVEEFAAAAHGRGFVHEETRAMPANNLALLFRVER